MYQQPNNSGLSRVPLDEVVSVSVEEMREVEGLIVIQSDPEDEFNSYDR